MAAKKKTAKKTTRKTKSAALAKVDPQAALARADEHRSVDELVERVELVQAVKERMMKEGLDYGTIPGTDKPTLLQPGADALMLAFRLSPAFEQTETLTDDGHLEVLTRCTLTHVPSGATLGEGVGSCSTREAKYAYRKAELTCPECGGKAIIKGKEEFGGGWVCWAKRGGCGAKYEDGARAIEGQPRDRVPNPDLPDTYNTVRKISAKRAKVAGVLNVTGGSRFFTQDVEDMPGDMLGGKGKARAKPANGNGRRAPAPAKDDVEDEAAREDLDTRISAAESGQDLNALVLELKERSEDFSEPTIRALNAHITNKRKKLARGDAREVHEGEFDEAGAGG